MLVDVLEASGDRVGDGLGDLLLHETSRKRAKGLVQQIVLAVTDGELERIDRNVHILDVEHAAAIPICRGQVDLNRQTLSPKEDVSETGIAELGEPVLLLEVERDVLHVSLDLGERDREVMVTLVGDGVVRRELEEVVGLERDDVGEEVLALEGEVLDDEVEHVIGILDTGDGDVPDLLDEGGEDDGPDVGPELRLEGKVAIGVEEEVLGETLPVGGEAEVEWVVCPGGEPGPDGVEEVVHVAFVLAIEELAAAVGQLVEAPRALRREDVAGLKKSLKVASRKLQCATLEETD